MSDTDKPIKTRKANVGSDPTKGSRVKLWQIGLYALAIGASVILVLVNIAMILGGAFSPILAVIALLIIGLSWGLVVAKDDGFEGPAGLKIAGAEPALRDFVSLVADQVEAPMPDEIYLVAEADLALTDATKFFGLKVDKTGLSIGMPLMRGFSRQEFAALLAHELAHRTETDVAHGPRAIRALQAAHDLIAVERKGFVNGIYGSYARKMFRSVGGVGVAQEEAADRLAAQAFGTVALVSALERYDDVVAAFDQMLRDYVVPALQSGSHPAELFEGFGELLNSSARADARIGDVERRHARERNEFELHRTPAERLATIRQWPACEPAHKLDGGDAPAHTLLDESEKSAVIVVGTWSSTLVTDRTEARTWQELADEVYSVRTHHIASSPFDDEGEDEKHVDPTSRFDQALAWAAAADWDRVDETIAKPLKKFDEGIERRAEWARCVVVEAAAANPGFHWQHSWDGPPLLVDPAGRAFNPAVAVEALIAGDSDAARSAMPAVAHR